MVEEFELAVSAMGACVWCLSRAHIDHTILSLANFKVCFEHCALLKLF